MNRVIWGSPMLGLWLTDLFPGMEGTLTMEDPSVMADGAFYRVSVEVL